MDGGRTLGSQGPVSAQGETEAPGVQRGAIHPTPLSQVARVAGNQAVIRILRQSGPEATVQRGGSVSAETAGQLATVQARAELLSAQARARHRAITEFVQLGLDGVRAARDDLFAVCDQYDQAYQAFQQTLTAARQRAEQEDNLRDAVLGVAIGVGVGLGAESVLAVGEDASQAAEFGAEVVGEVIEALGGQVNHSVQQSRTAGRDQAIQPGQGTHPDSRRVEALRKVNLAFEAIVRLSLDTELFAEATHGADLAVAEARVQATGDPGRVTLQQLVADVDRLAQASDRAGTIDARLADGRAAINQLRTDAAAARAAANAHVMEQDLWIRWMAPMSSDVANQVLDLNPIEDHLTAIGVLGPGGRLGVDFGAWTSHADTDDARRRAYWMTRRMDLIGHQGLVARADAGGVFVDFPGQPKLWQVTVAGSASLQRGTAVQVTSAGQPDSHLIVSVTGVGNPDDARADLPMELEFEGEPHAAPGHI